MHNKDESKNNQDTQSEQLGSKQNLLILAITGLFFGILLAYVFASHEKGDNNSHQSQPVKLVKSKKSQDNTVQGKSRKTVDSIHRIKTTSTAIDEDPGETVKRVYGHREKLNVLPAPTLHPRDESEWQGMLIDKSLQAICEGKNSCGLAMACIDNRCGPCSNDSDCGTGETCILDHCLVEDNSSCRTASDCERGELCILSGYSIGPRGNEKTLSYCQATVSGSKQSKEQLENLDPDTPGPDVIKRPVSMDQLHDTLLEFEDQNLPSLEEESISQKQAEPFDENKAETEFKEHEAIDKIDPDNEHIIIEETDEISTDTDPLN